jgi:hypothetical protein
MFLDLALEGNEVLAACRAAPPSSASRPTCAWAAATCGARAHWVRTDVLAWDVGLSRRVRPSRSIRHHADRDLTLGDGGVEGGPGIRLSVDDDGLPADVLRQFPHLAGHTALRLDRRARAVGARACCAASSPIATYRDGRLVDATGLQLAGVLDDRYATDAPLGVTWDGDVPSIAVWAPTARSVRCNASTSSGPRSRRADASRRRHRRVVDRRRPRVALVVLPVRGRGVRAETGRVEPTS